jgi:hypothetical protein
MKDLVMSMKGFSQVRVISKTHSRAKTESWRLEAYGEDGLIVGHNAVSL